MKKKKFLLAILVFLAIILIFIYPVERKLALRAYKDYRSAQGIGEENIESEEVFRDYKNGGYKIVANYKDDPGLTYYYSYYPWTHRRGENLRFNRIFLNISNSHEQLGPPYENKCKYPPLYE
ncbi:DUF3139 domain-containing protein [Anaerococcus tetradius]|uniref:DUF3139 domain-containing protein n=1 Tax=Anaerococcus tetradius TaxID=33036 RepID=UPI0023F0EB90|nr:DUF3139 domain-containing protein [Anaerococcus tetradius]